MDGAVLRSKRRRIAATRRSDSFAHTLGCDRIHIYTRFTEEVGEDRRAQLRELVRRRVEGCPVAYLVGRKEFYRLSFEVSPAVLIPRPATESLVVRALELLEPLSAPRVLDVGTGSGCIAVSIAKLNVGATIVAVDVSDEALAVARRNAERHGVVGRIQFANSDVYAGINDQTPFDLIVSNPPYISSGSIPSQASGVREHEPRSAIDGGPDGLAVFDRLIRGAAERPQAGRLAVGGDRFRPGIRSPSPAQYHPRPDSWPDGSGRGWSSSCRRRAAKQSDRMMGDRESCPPSCPPSHVTFLPST